MKEVSDHLDAMEHSMPSSKAYHVSKQSRQETVKKRIKGYEAMGEYLLKKSKTDNIVKSGCFCVEHMQECSIAKDLPAQPSKQPSPHSIHIELRITFIA